MRVLKRGGAIEVKTDNNALFDFTLREGEAAGLEAVRLTRDLHASGLPAAAITTEYEEKFSSQGNPIYKMVADRQPAASVNTGESVI